MHDRIFWLRRHPRGKGSTAGFLGFLALMGIWSIARATVLYTRAFENRLLVKITGKFGETAARIVCTVFGAVLTVVGIWGMIRAFQLAVQNQ